MLRPAFALLIPNLLPIMGRVKMGAFSVVLAAALLTPLACRSEPTATASPSPAATAPAPTATGEQPPVEGHQPTVASASASVRHSLESGNMQELNVIMATTVLEVGTQRVAFLLTTPTGLVKEDNQVFITPVYLPSNSARASIETRFHQWPYGTRGAFAAQMDFDRPGSWRLDITAEGPDGGRAAAEIEVLDDSPVPFIGSVGPLSENKTLSSVDDIALLTTDYSPDPALYEVTIREAVESPLPAVVVFASPAFCTTATCGPQVDAVSELREAYGGQAHFIHVEIYDNPSEIQGDLDRARIALTVDQWGISGLPHWFNESWTFVLNAGGQVHNRFEGFATVTELEESLRSTLK